MTVDLSGMMSRMCMRKFRNFPLRINKALAIFRKQVTTPPVTTRTTVVALRDPSGSKKSSSDWIFRRLALNQNSFQVLEEKCHIMDRVRSGGDTGKEQQQELGKI